MRYNVAAYQKRLNELGYPLGKLDGLYGPMTRAAVESFQKEVGLKVDGVVGPATWGKLFPKPSAPKAQIENPAWINEALKARGLHEVVNKQELIEWLKSDGATLGDPQKYPWCGDFVATAMALGVPLEPLPDPVKKNPYWAQNWQFYGDEAQPQYGAILVFKRKGGGHVGFYMAETPTFYMVLGGNQSNSVNISKVAKKRCIAVRWPKTVLQNKRRVQSSGKNISITTNEE